MSRIEMLCVGKVVFGDVRVKSGVVKWWLSLVQYGWGKATSSNAGCSHGIVERCQVAVLSSDVVAL